MAGSTAWGLDRHDVGKIQSSGGQVTHTHRHTHHFREHVRKGLIKIFPVDTKDQIADALIKPLAQNDFQRHPHFMCGK